MMINIIIKRELTALQVTFLTGLPAGTVTELKIYF
jgi:hypothetical protein